MSMKDKLKGTKDKVVGKAKEVYGDVANDPEKELEGKLQHAKGHAEEKIGKAKDETEETSDDLKRKVNDKIDDWKE